MLVVPIVFCSLICGICHLKDFTSLGRISIKTISFYIFTTSIAITMAIILASIIDPGVSSQSLTITNSIEINQAPKISEILINIIPKNPFESLVQGNMLQVIFFCFINW